MKKKIRSIQVKENEFTWLIVERILPECCLKIWSSSRKGKLWIKCIFNDPIIVTPRTVSSLINRYYDQRPSKSKTFSTIKITGDEICSL